MKEETSNNPAPSPEKLRCMGLTTKGMPCRNFAVEGTMYCHLKAHKKLNWRTFGGIRFVLKSYFFTPVSKITALAILLIGPYQIWLHYAEKKANAKAGFIKPAAYSGKKYLSTGSARFIIDEPNGTFLMDGDRPLLSMIETNGQLLVSTVIRNADGDIVARLDRNEWTFVSGSKLGLDRNYTNNAFECLDSTGRVVLQVVSVGDTIHLAGVLRCRSGKEFSLTQGDGGTFFSRTDSSRGLREIPPIFNYPSDRHFGECPGFDELAKTIPRGNGPAYRLGGALDLCGSKAE